MCTPQEGLCTEPGIIGEIRETHQFIFGDRCGIAGTYALLKRGMRGGVSGRGASSRGDEYGNRNGKDSTVDIWISISIPCHVFHLPGQCSEILKWCAKRSGNSREFCRRNVWVDFCKKTCMYDVTRYPCLSRAKLSYNFASRSPSRPHSLDRMPLRLRHSDALPASRSVYLRSFLCNTYCPECSERNVCV